MDKDSFLRGFLIFSGYLEIGFGLFFIFFMDFFLKTLGLPNLPLFSQMAGLELSLLGFLLLYSARDIEKYLIIPIISIILRFIMPILEIYTMILYPQLIVMLLPGALYDAISAAFTLILLKKCEYI